jgi:hypothetical protein
MEQTKGMSTLKFKHLTIRKVASIRKKINDLTFLMATATNLYITVKA